MSKYRFIVEVDTDTPEHAVQVMSERTGYDEEYDSLVTGKTFDYQITWSIPQDDGYNTLSNACNVFYSNDEPEKGN